jgi:hypothetical protein
MISYGLILITSSGLVQPRREMRDHQDQGRAAPEQEALDCPGVSILAPFEREARWDEQDGSL